VDRFGLDDSHWSSVYGRYTNGRFGIADVFLIRPRPGHEDEVRECLETIKRVFSEQGYLMDPHTAVAFAAAENLKGINPVLVASTAHWAKFGDNVYRALHGIAPGEALPPEAAGLTGCQLNRLIAEETGKHDIPAGLAGLDDAEARFTTVLDADEPATEKAVEAFISTQNG